MTHITIYHNPKCSTSRNTLALLCEHSDDVQVVLYLETPPTREALQAIIQATGGDARQIMRRKESLYSELNLDDPSQTQEALVNAMLAQPILIERPIVTTPLGTRLCRPVDAVFEILPKP